MPYTVYTQREHPNIVFSTKQLSSTHGHATGKTCDPRMVGDINRDFVHLNFIYPEYLVNCLM